MPPVEIDSIPSLPEVPSTTSSLKTVDKALELPIINDAVNMATKLHLQATHYPTYNHVEAFVTNKVQMVDKGLSQGVKNTVASAVSSLDSLASTGLDKLTTKVPALTTPTEEILPTIKDTFSASTGKITDTLSTTTAKEYVASFTVVQSGLKLADKVLSLGVKTGVNGWIKKAGMNGWIIDVLHINAILGFLGWSHREVPMTTIKDGLEENQDEVKDALEEPNFEEESISQNAAPETVEVAMEESHEKSGETQSEEEISTEKETSETCHEESEEIIIILEDSSKIEEPMDQEETNVSKDEECEKEEAELEVINEAEEVILEVIEESLEIVRNVSEEFEGETSGNETLKLEEVLQEDTKASLDEASEKENVGEYAVMNETAEVLLETSKGEISEKEDDVSIESEDEASENENPENGLEVSVENIQKDTSEDISDDCSTLEEPVHEETNASLDEASEKEDMVKPAAINETAEIVPEVSKETSLEKVEAVSQEYKGEATESPEPMIESFEVLEASQDDSNDETIESIEEVPSKVTVSEEVSQEQEDEEQEDESATFQNNLPKLTDC